ncbi:hypothetical protein [Streptomyces sp. NPDC002851]
MRTTITARAAGAAATAAVLAFVLTGCNETDDPAAAPSTESSAPAGDKGTDGEQGTGGAGDTGGSAGAGGDAPASDGFADALGAEEAATATYKDDDGATKLEIKPKKIVKGDWADFEGFDLEADDKKGMVPYYVTVSYTSLGGAEPWITTWDGKRNLLAGPDQEIGRITMLDDFEPCPVVDPNVKSGQFKKGYVENICKVYGVPENTKELYVRWGVGGTGEDVDPIVWKVLG